MDNKEPDTTPDKTIVRKDHSLAVFAGTLSFLFGAIGAYKYASPLIDSTHAYAELPSQMAGGAIVVSAASLVASAAKMALRKPLVTDPSTLFKAAAIGLCAGVVEMTVVCMTTSHSQIWRDDNRIVFVEAETVKDNPLPYSPQVI